MRRIPIFFSFDDNYVIPAAVAFWSLLDRARKDVAYDMYVLHHDISAENQRLLEGIVSEKGNATLRFMDTAGFLADEWTSGNWEGHQSGTQFTSDTLVRCFAARFFPELDKIIYSDVDVVFRDDISDLWDFDVGDVYIAGVLDFLMKHSRTELSHLRQDHYDMLKDSYIVGGIWVLNLRKIRADGLESKMLDVVKDDTIVKRWNDQDIVNIACGGKVAFLPLNYISYPYLPGLLRDPSFTSHYSRDELYDSFINPKIIHYASVKPWNGAPVRGDEWWAVHDYLRLPERAGIDYSRETPLEKRYRKMKKRLNACRAAVVVLSLAALALLALLLCF